MTPDELAQMDSTSLARMLYAAYEESDDAIVALAENEIVGRIGIPLDDSEQGITDDARLKIDTFVENWRLRYEDRRRRVGALMYWFRSSLKKEGDNWTVEDVEEDENGAPGSTTDFDGRALAVICWHEGLEYRILIEDITIDDEVPSLLPPVLHVIPGCGHCADIASAWLVVGGSVELYDKLAAHQQDHTPKPSIHGSVNAIAKRMAE